jgi:RNA polymerase sigma factor (sigma-70 family)
MSVRIRLPNPLAALDDRALLARFADRRDQPAFEQLVKRHGGLVFGVCRRAVRDRHLAEDAFQAVFLVLARDPGRAAGAASVGGWLFGVARRVGLAARRHEIRRERRDARRREQGAPPESHPPAPRDDFGDLLHALDEELAALPEDLRAALVACFLEERTQDEAARELGWSLSTLRRRLDRGKDLLRARLARRGAALAVGFLTAALAARARAAVPPLALTPSPGSAALAAEIVRRGATAKLAALVAVVGLATGGWAVALTAAPGDSPIAPARAAAPAPAPQAATGRRPDGAKARVTVSGRVLFPNGRPLPTPRPVPADQIKDADVWRPFGPLVYEDLRVSAERRGLANAVVFLRPDSDDRRAEFPARVAAPPVDRTVRATGGHFVPRVSAVRAGDRVTFDNQLPVPTNVLYAAADGDDFNVLLAGGMAHTTKPRPAAAAPDRYRSGIYPWMAGTVWAFDHPYFAVTDADGRFEITPAPAGACRLVVWHETGGYLGGAAGRLGVPVAGPELAPLTFESPNW